jgi:hypothetical protein
MEHAGSAARLFHERAAARKLKSILFLGSFQLLSLGLGFILYGRNAISMSVEKEQCFLS